MHFFTKFVALATFLATTSTAVPIVCGGANQTPCPSTPFPGKDLGIVSKEATRDVSLESRFVCGEGHGIPCPDKPIPGAALGAVSKSAQARDDGELEARIVCGGNSPIPCPDTPVPGAGIGAVSKAVQTRDDGELEARVVCGGANQIPCPDTPLPGAAFGAVSKLATRRIPCGGTNQIPCPDKPFGGPISLPKNDGPIPGPPAAEGASPKQDASSTPEKRLTVECFVAPCPGDGSDQPKVNIPGIQTGPATPGAVVPQKRIAPITGPLKCNGGPCPDVATNDNEGEVKIQTVPNPPASEATGVSPAPKKRLPSIDNPIECFVAPCPGDGPADGEIKIQTVPNPPTPAATSGTIKRRSGMRRVSGGVNAIL